MEDSTSREKILKKIRNALISKEEIPYPDIDFEDSVFKELEESLEINFAQEFNNAGGQFVYCDNEQDFLDNLRFLISNNKWENILTLDPGLTDILQRGKIPYLTGKEKIKSTKTGITRCEFLIARLGSIIVSSGQLSGRRMNVYPDVHIVLAYTSQLVPDLKDAFARLNNKYENRLPSLISLITGPSRTADIEKTLVMGAHGPKELYVFLVEDLI